jgi:hypothetical protein
MHESRCTKAEERLEIEHACRDPILTNRGLSHAIIPQLSTPLRTSLSLLRLGSQETIYSATLEKVVLLVVPQGENLLASPLGID